MDSFDYGVISPLQPFASDLVHTSTPLCFLSMIHFHSSADNLVGNVLAWHLKLLLLRLRALTDAPLQLCCY